MANTSNLKPFKKGDNRARECQKKSVIAAAENRKRKASMKELTTAMLNSSLKPKQAKQMHDLFPDMSEEDLTVKSTLARQALIIAIKGKRESDRLTAIRLLMEIIGETPEMETMKQIEQMKQTKYEDDPLTKSIKELLK